MKIKQIVNKQERGLALMGLIIVISIITIAGVLIVNNSDALFGGSKKNVSEQEVIRIIQEIQQWRINNNNYSGVSVAAMNTDGYDIASVTTGVGDNVYGLDTIIASANSDAAATLTYQTEATDQCAKLIEHIDNTGGVSGTPTCAGTGPFTLTVIIN